MKPIQIKVSDTDLANWKSSAQQDGMGLSEWIRGRCNANDRTQPVRDSEPVRLVQQSTSAPERPTRSTAASDTRDAIALEVARKNGHPVGCECFHCLQTLRFLKPMVKKEEKKQARRK